MIMVRFLIYLALIFSSILCVYIFVPDFGVVEVHNENFYFETSIEVFTVFLTLIALIFSLVVLFIFWILRLPSTLRTALSGYFYKKKVEKLLDIVYLVDTGHLKEASKKYVKNDFDVIDHKMVEKVKQKILEFKKESE